MNFPTLSTSESVIVSSPAKVVGALQSQGVQGLVVLSGGGMPLLVRDYGFNGLFQSANAQIFTGFVSALTTYADGINGFLTDVGLGGARLILKRSKGGITYALFLDERFHRRYTGEQLAMFVELALYNLTQSFQTFLELVMGRKEENDSGTLEIFEFQADVQLYESIIGARKVILERLDGF